jgi:hypothetical protein
MILLIGGRGVGVDKIKVKKRWASFNLIPLLRGRGGGGGVKRFTAGGGPGAPPALPPPPPQDQPERMKLWSNQSEGNKEALLHVIQAHFAFN